MSRALRLHESYTRPELVEQVRQLQADPAAQQTGELHLLTRAARRKLGDLLLAIYWHDRPLGNTRQQPAQPDMKWW